MPPHRRLRQAPAVPRFSPCRRYFFNHGFVESRTRGARCEARPRDAAHDAADSRVDKDLQII